MTIFRDLLNMDKLAREHGCGLNPRLRAELEKDTCWPVRAASPQREIDTADLPETVVRFAPRGAVEVERSA